jgi:hypothetical protein
MTLLYAAFDVFCTRNVAALRILIAAAQQKDDLRPAPIKIDPIARADMDAHFKDAIANTSNISQMAVCGTEQPVRDTRSTPPVTELAEPIAKNGRFRYLERLSCI